MWCLCAVLWTMRKIHSMSSCRSLDLVVCVWRHLNNMYVDCQCKLVDQVIVGSGAVQPVQSICMRTDQSMSGVVQCVCVLCFVLMVWMDVPYRSCFSHPPFVLHFSRVPSKRCDRVGRECCPNQKNRLDTKQYEKHTTKIKKSRRKRK